MRKYTPDEEIDALCDDFESQLLSGQAPSIEAYLGRVDGSRQPRFLYWLLLLQLTTCPASEQQTHETFRGRFPGFEDVVADAFQSLPQPTGSLPQIPGYTIMRSVARGGQGEVYQAIQDRTGQHVAIKLVSTSELDRIPEDHRSTVLTQLKTEIRTAAGLNHPNIIKVFDAGDCPDGFFFVMQWVDGGSLSERISEFSQLESAKIVRSVAEALQEAHTSEVLHLDVKPHNILFDEVANEPLLADFGLARLSRETAEVNAIAGTLGYMAPEQARGSELDIRTDVYGLGATFYHLLTGRKAYDGVRLPFDDTQRQSWIPTPPRVVNRDINPELERICLKCLELEPDERFQDCLAVAQALERFGTTEDGHRISEMSTRALVTCPLFLLVNVLVFLQIRFGWANRADLEPWIWLTMFSMYAGVFHVIGSARRLDSHSPERLALESLWSIWLGKLLAAMAIAGCLRLLASGGNPMGADEAFSRSEEAILMCYPMFSALTGMALATTAPRYWRAFYGLAVLAWLNCFILMWTIVLGSCLAPVIYGASMTALAAVWGTKLRRLARERSGTMPTATIAPTIHLVRERETGPSRSQDHHTG